MLNNSPLRAFFKTLVRYSPITGDAPQWMRSFEHPPVFALVMDALFFNLNPPPQLPDADTSRPISQQQHTALVPRASEFTLPSHEGATSPVTYSVILSAETPVRSP